MISALTFSDPNFSFDELEPTKHSLKFCKDYIARYFVPLSCGNIAVFKDGKYSVSDDTTVRKVYFNRMPKFDYKTEDGTKSSFDFSKWFFSVYTGIRSISFEVNKEVFYDDKINLCPRMKHQYVQYETFSKSIQKKVHVLLNYIKEILSNGRDDVQGYILKWLAHMVKGKKNDSILYLRAKQGFGKSTLQNFIRKHVVGSDLSLEEGSNPLISDFNERLAGKIFVAFEELESFSKSQWMSISARIKRYATSDVMTVENKNVKAYTVQNLMNIMIMANEDAVMDDDGRRYMILDIATHRQVIPNCDSDRNVENRKYWDKVYSCFNDEVGHAFYCYLMEVDTTNYVPQDFPTTQSKLDSYAKRMDSHENFLKYNYVLNRSELKTTLGDLYEEYVSFCRGSGISKPYSKVELGKKLREIGIEPYKSNDKLKIKVSAKDLAQIAKSFNWVHETDEYYDKDSKKKNKQALPDPSGLDAGLDCEEIDNEEILKKLSDKEKEVQDLNEQFEKMRLEFADKEKEVQELNERLKRFQLEVNACYIPELKYAYGQVKEERKQWIGKYYEIYNIWYATLSKEEQKKEDEDRYNQGACESEDRTTRPYYEQDYETLIQKAERERRIKADQIQNLKEVNFIDDEPPAPPVAPKSPPNILVIEDSDEEESEPEPPKPRPKSKKSILKLIEDSDEDEPDPEEEFVRLKDSKIVDFLEPEQEVSFLE